MSLKSVGTLPFTSAGSKFGFLRSYFEGGGRNLFAFFLNVYTGTGRLLKSSIINDLLINFNQ